jgi:hypothetical protein
MNILKKLWYKIKFRNVSGGWMAFCAEHFDEALAHFTKKYPIFDVGWGDAYTPDQFDDNELDQEALKEYICDYPDCDKYPAHEIIWMRPFTAKDMRSTAYIPLELTDDERRKTKKSE